MPTPIRVLCFHGLGKHQSTNWGEQWRLAIEPAAAGAPDVRFDFRFPTYDPIFEDVEIGFADTVGALWKLASSGFSVAFQRRPRGWLSDVSDRIRWTAGYVVAFVENAEFRDRTREFVLKEIASYKPDVLLAHSLGSLITYSALSHDSAEGIEAILKKAHYVSFGSQIGNPFVVGNLTHGRVRPLEVAHWHHLYNAADDVFTAPLSLPGVPNFSQLLTPFDLPGLGDHSGEEYLGHPVTYGSFWQPLVAQHQRSAPAKTKKTFWSRATPKKSTARRRALLVGIDDYPNEADRLFGCVNDVFAMSATLQDCGFEPEEIRVCLNDRATAEGILTRMEWLVDGAQHEDRLVFYYSGHGARVPEYGAFEEPDRLSETLVPYDFDWSPERSISDEIIFRLYAQLPYSVQFLMIFDCCHSGSMHRLGSNRARGIDPPDDIRHRQLKWDRKEEMWIERHFENLNSAFTDQKEDEAAFFGKEGSTMRLGRAAALRVESDATYQAAKAAEGPIGPFLPLIIQACSEEELSYEYRHGATSYGAFTFCLTSILRQEVELTFERLVTLARERLKRLGYRQTPQILGPSIHMAAKIPFETGRGAGAPAQTLPGSATPRTTG
ncbi:MAG TPA: caspase family protein [Devosiaceae bacterium]|nr:caspase family protein [Devosiaceae bacterium]